MASSSTPICSMSSGVRWAMGLTGCFWMTVMGVSSGVDSVIDRAVAGGGADAGLDVHAVPHGGGGDLPVAQVAHGALAQRQHAAEADAHAAPARHQHARGLGGV